MKKNFSIHAPQWAGPSRDGINLMLTFEGAESIPYTARADDPEPGGADLFVRAQAGEFGPVAEYAQPSTPLADALRQIDADTDALYAQVIGSRGAEYEQAERDARTWTEAGSTGDAPDSVASWAAASGMTQTQAAADILAQAAAWRGAMAQIRAQRLAAKAAVRAGTVDAALAGWAVFLGGMRLQLGL